MSKEEQEDRKNHSAEFKFKVVKEALTTDIGVSGVCRKYGVSPGLFYKWQEKFFAGAVEGLQRAKSDQPTAAQVRKTAELEAKVNRMQSVIAEITAENIDFKKKAWGLVAKEQIPYEVRTMIKSDIEIQYKRTEITVSKLLSWYGLSSSTYYGWIDAPVKVSKRYNPASVLEDEEQAVVNYRIKNRNVGYRKFTWMMNDAEIAFLSESAVYSILSKHNLLGVESYNGAGAEDEYRQKPHHIHDHWHTDLAYVKIKGVFYFLSMILDGYSRYILGWELLTDMTTMSVQDLFLKVRAKYPDGRPKLINDNGSCYISKDFKSLVSNLEIQQVFTRRNHPETNGKIERLNGTVRQEALRLHYPTSFVDAEGVIDNFVHFYNNKRLHAGIQYTTPADVFQGRQQQVLNSRKTKLEVAKLARININKRLRRDADLSQFIN